MSELMSELMSVPHALHQRDDPTAIAAGDGAANRHCHRRAFEST